MLNAVRQKMTDLDTRRPTLRSFGISVGGVFLVLSAGVAWMSSAGPGPWSISLGGVGGTLVVLGVVVPTVLRPVYVAWMGGASALRLVMTPVLLTLIYVLVVTPTGLLLRLSGADPMRRQSEPDRDSYWQEKETRVDGDERLQTYY